MKYSRACLKWMAVAWLIAMPIVGQAQPSVAAPTLDAFARVLEVGDAVWVVDPQSSRRALVTTTEQGVSVQLSSGAASAPDRPVAVGRPVLVPLPAMQDCVFPTAFASHAGQLAVQFHWECGEDGANSGMASPTGYTGSVVDLFGPEGPRLDRETAYSRMAREGMGAPFWAPADAGLVERAVNAALSAHDRGDSAEVARIRDGLTWRGEVEIVDTIESALRVRRAVRDPASAMAQLTADLAALNCDSAREYFAALSGGPLATRVRALEPRLRTACAADARHEANRAALSAQFEALVAGCWREPAPSQVIHCFRSDETYERREGRRVARARWMRFSDTGPAMFGDLEAQRTILVQDGDTLGEFTFIVQSIDFLRDGVRMRVVDDTAEGATPRVLVLLRIEEATPRQ